jgi:hypothetical protein
MSVHKRRKGDEQAMNPQYEFYLEVKLPSGEVMASKVTASVSEVPVLAPVDICDTFQMAMLAGGVDKRTAGMRDDERRNLAKRIAAQMIESIMAAIKARDTVNGYAAAPEAAQ